MVDFDVNNVFPMDLSGAKQIDRHRWPTTTPPMSLINLVQWQFADWRRLLAIPYRRLRGVLISTYLRGARSSACRKAIGAAFVLLPSYILASVSVNVLTVVVLPWSGQQIRTAFFWLPDLTMATGVGWLVRVVAELGWLNPPVRDRTMVMLAMPIATPTIVKNVRPRLAS